MTKIEEVTLEVWKSSTRKLLENRYIYPNETGFKDYFISIINEQYDSKKKRDQQHPAIQKKHILEENVESSPLSENKKIKQLEALQELIQIRPDLKGKSVYFFYKSNKFVEGILIYDRSENMSYVYDPKSGNKFNSFFQWLNVLKKQGLFNGERSAIATIFLEPVTSSPNLASILRPSVQLPYWKNNSTASLRLIFFGSEGNVEKDMTIVWNGNLISYEVNVLGKVVKDIDLIRPGVAAERTFTDVEEAIEYVFDAKICNGKSTKGFEEVTRNRGLQLVNNKLGPDGTHEPFAFLENKGKPNEIYRRVDCHLLVDLKGACENCKKLKNTLIKIRSRYLTGTKSVKTNHASQEILSNAAYDSLKGIMRLPSVSTLKSYINEYEQKSGWQDETAHRILCSLALENVWGHGRIGFFSHDSFKIQKGLLWSQRSNSYVGYLDFEDEAQDLKSFAINCEKELNAMGSNTISPDHISEKYEHGLATQVHQIVWHSITHNFSFPLSYYGVNTLSTHDLNTLLFGLAAKLECIGIHTCGSVCDGASENRNHIKSFDWFASTWSVGDIVEVVIEKGNSYSAKILNANIDHTKFIVQKLDQEFTEGITIDWKFLRPVIGSQLSINEDQKIVSEHDIWSWHKTLNPITGDPWFFISDPTHVFKKLRNNLSKSHTGQGSEKNVREIMFDGKEVSWKHIKGVYDYTSCHATAKATRLTKCHIWLTSWSKMRVDLAEQTLSKDVENALEAIEELKDISEGTRKFIRNSRYYRHIFHSKISFINMEDPRIKTLKNIHDWFLLGDNQKKGAMEWISSQCQFDLILSINGFLGMLEYILSRYKIAAIQPRRISQDMLEGLFGTIRELSGDSSTQTLQGYGHALNKYQITALESSEVKSFNYGNANNVGSGMHFLSRRDYRKQMSNESNPALVSLNLHSSRLVTLSLLSQKIFETLLQDDLLMGRIAPLSNSLNEYINNENLSILNSNVKRYELIEFLIYHNSIDVLLQNWQNEVRLIAQSAIPKKRGVKWMLRWSSNLENRLNNYLCSGTWFVYFQQEFQLSQFSLSVQRIVAFSMLQKVILETFKGNGTKNVEFEKGADPNLLPQVIVNLDPAEASKFAYIVGWVLFKLTKDDKVMMSHPKFGIMRSLLKNLCSENVEYVHEIHSQTTNIIPGPEIMDFMYHFESIIIQLFEKHHELGPNILHYIRISLLNNLHLHEKFSSLLKFAIQDNISSENFEGKLTLSNEDLIFLFEKLVSTYMKSWQKTWRQHNGYIPEKGTASLRENLKVMRSNNQNLSNNEKGKISNQIKKANLPTDPMLALVQLQVWAHLEDVENQFAKNFLVTDLLWLLWAFGVKTSQKRKNTLVPLLISHLKSETPFSEEALAKKNIFALE
ncbi:9385_t:CDS:2 [Entrophospora sp. SA101]|nr:9385_t:CDS:2 [Entrophospora sp. SA101]